VPYGRPPESAMVEGKSGVRIPGPHATGGCHEKGYCRPPGRGRGGRGLHRSRRFESALAAGAPLRHAAWDGTQAELPMSLRLASAVTMAFYGLAAVVILRRGGFQIGWLSRAVARVGTWVLVVILPLSALAIFSHRVRGRSS
jgi:hypothetical protein